MAALGDIKGFIDFCVERGATSVDIYGLRVKFDRLASKPASQQDGMLAASRYYTPPTPAEDQAAYERTMFMSSP